MKDIAPYHTLSSYSCPHCKAISHQDWFYVSVDSFRKGSTPVKFRDDLEAWLLTEEAQHIDNEDGEKLLATHQKQQTGKIFDDGYTSNTRTRVGNFHLSKCYSCEEYGVWLHYKLIWPEQNTRFEPNDDMPDKIKSIFIEASSLFEKSPRASAALLRLAIENLCNILNGKVQNINKGIASLVKNGLNSRTQKALDIVRVTGNDAVHPGHINLNDDPEVAARLFRLVNVIVEELISLPNEIDAIYDELPKTKKDAIEKRDN